MCGICGVVDLDGRPVDRGMLGTMADSMAHRGPDGSGVWASAEPGKSPAAGLGHRRLAIIDLTDAARQPLGNEDGSVQVVFNGEIYDFTLLRARLEARGHQFRSRTDGEVIVHGYEEYGDDVVHHLDGMFAFALWDDSRKRLLLGRDRAGKKPLYYSWDGRRFAFASEIKALRRCPWVKDDVAWVHVPALLVFGNVPSPDTIHSAIRQVPAAATMVVDERGPAEPRTYWHLQFPSGENGARRQVGWEEAAEGVRDHLRAAVVRRLVSDVPVGVLLSGGVDSSVVVALMAEAGATIRTFTAGVADDPSYDERRYARLVAERFGTEHVELEVRVDAFELLERVVWHTDLPFSDTSSLPTFAICRAAREHVTVALVGDGGDEVFAGYERFMAALLADRLPQRVQHVLGATVGLLPADEGYFSLRRRLQRFTDDPSLPIEERYLSWVSVFAPSELKRVLMGPVEGRDHLASFERLWADSIGWPLLHRLQHVNFHTYLHDDLLVKMDRMSMANSLETRSPYLDTALIEFVTQLAPAMKATPYGAKRILRRMARDLVPKEVVNRRKQGFGLPVGQWFRGELREPFEDLVLASDALSGEVLDRTGVRSLFTEHLAGRRDHGEQLAALLILEFWLRMLKADHTDVGGATGLSLRSQ